MVDDRNVIRQLGSHLGKQVVFGYDRYILPELDEMIGGGLITLERARVIMYRPGN